MVYQISVLLKDTDVAVSWDALADALKRELHLKDIVVEKSGAFQCRYFIPGGAEEALVRKQVKEAIRFSGTGKELDPAGFAVSVREVTEEAFSKLKQATAIALSARKWLPERQDQKETAGTRRQAASEASAKAAGSGERQAASVREKPRVIPPERKETEKAEAQPKTLAELAEELSEIREKLCRKVRGQRHAVYELTQGIFESEMFSRFDEGRKGPISTFLFMGPSGVGKTFLAKEFAALSGRPVLVVDMSEYSDNLANLKFNGDHGENAVVTGFVRRNPNAILIFDEIEKAHINTIHLFLQILDAGQLMDQQLKREVSFRDTTVIMTTNVGSELYDNAEVRNLSGIPRSALINALKSEKLQGGVDRKTAFPESITTRMANGHIVMFNHLEPYALMEIVRDEINLQLELFRKATGITVHCDEVDFPALIMYAGGAAADARTLRGLARNTVVKEIQDAVLQLGASSDRRLDSLSEIHITVAIPKEGEIYALFRQTKGMQAAVFAEEAEALSGAAAPFLELHVTGDTAAFKKRLRGVTDFVLLDPFAGFMQEERMPADMEDIRSAGMEMFNYLSEYYPEIPVYLLETGRYGSFDYSTLLSRGARGVLELNGSKEAVSQGLRESSLNALIGNSIYHLGRSGKFLSYNCAQYIRSAREVEISFANLHLRTAVKGEDYTSVFRGSEAGSVGFDDIVGCDTAKKALMQIRDILRDPRKRLLAGEKLPKGILLYGPPGTGKTMLAKALANSADAMFLPTTATSFFGSLVGQTEQNIRELFRKARRYAPAVIFIDEADAVGRRRTGSVSTSHNEDALNELLAEMDGFVVDEKRPVFVLAATNYEIEGDGNRVLDPAFVRRFERRLYVALPDTDARFELFSRCLQRHSIRFGEDHDAVVRNMAERSAGMCSADIETVVENYARNLGDEAPTAGSFLDALDAFRYGDVKNMDESALRQTACHEAGHALVSWICGVKPLFMTIVSRGDYGGYMQTSAEGKLTSTFEELKDTICRCLAGRAAELEICGETSGINTGASSDLKKARYLVKACLEDYGMGSTLFKESDKDQGEALMQDQLRRARRIVAGSRAAMDKLVELLIREKSLNKEAIDAFFRENISPEEQKAARA